MFDKSRNASDRRSALRDSEAGSFSIIARDVTIAGTIAAGEDIQINGVVEGDVQCVNLTLGETGRVVGAIKAQQVIVAGTVEGPITATKVVLGPSARVAGDVSYQELSIELGARVSGQLVCAQPALKLVTNEAVAG